MTGKEVGLLVKKARLAQGLTQAQLGKAIGVTHTTIQRLEIGEQNIALFKILKLADALKIEPYRLFSLEPMVPRAVADKEPAIIEVFPDEATKLEYSKFRTRDDFLAVRILEDVASLGPGAMIAQERTHGYALIYKPALPKQAEKQKRSRERIVALFAKGDSMAPSIQGGSLVAIDIEDKVEIKNYKIYAIEIPGEGVTIKRVFLADHDLILMADNRETVGFPRCIHIKELDYNPVCGRVVWTWNKF